jgi:Family of unknown function (DUF6252)
MRTPLAALVAMVLLSSCSEPFALDTEGALLFQSRVDGVSWTPDNGVNISATFLPDGSFLVVAIRRDSLFRARDGMGIVLRHLTAPGQYVFTSSAAGDCGLYSIYDPVNSTTDANFVSTPPNVGQVDITDIDTVNHRIAGRFEFEAQEDGGARRVHVTDGVFRVEYEVAP